MEDHGRLAEKKEQNPSPGYRGLLNFRVWRMVTGLVLELFGSLAFLIAMWVTIAFFPACHMQLHDS